jgi:hypothetical protein
MTVADQLFEEAKHLPEFLVRGALDFVLFLRHRHESQSDEAAPQPSEQAVLAMLERSRSDVLAGNIVPMEPVLARMRATAASIRAARTSADSNR